MRNKNSFLYIAIGLFILTYIMVTITGDTSKILVYILSVLSLKWALNKRHWYNPYFLFVITHLSYILYNPTWGGLFMDELAFSTKALVVLSLTALVLGAKIIENWDISPLNIGYKCENFFLVLSIGLIPTLLSLLIYGNITELEGSELAEAKNNFSLPIIGQLAYFLPASIIVACKQNNNKKLLAALILTIAASLLTVSKTALAVAFFFLLIGLERFCPSLTQTNYYRLIKQTSPILLPLLLLTFFTYNNTKRNTEDGYASMNFIEAGNIQSIWGTDLFAQNIFLNYAYFVQPWSNLNINVERNNQSETFGSNTIAQFAKKIGIEVNLPQKLTPTFFNTHTYLTDYYLDFGIIGAIIMSCVIGMFIYFFYRKFGLSDDPLLMSFYVLVAYATSMMFFSNHFNNGYLLNYLITFGFVSFLTRHFSR